MGREPKVSHQELLCASGNTIRERKWVATEALIRKGAGFNSELCRQCCQCSTTIPNIVLYIFVLANSKKKLEVRIIFVLLQQGLPVIQSCEQVFILNDEFVLIDPNTGGCYGTWNIGREYIKCIIYSGLQSFSLTFKYIY